MSGIDIKSEKKTVTIEEAFEIVVRLYKDLQRKHDILKNAIELEVKRTGGTVPILTKALKEIETK